MSSDGSEALFPSFTRERALFFKGPLCPSSPVWEEDPLLIHMIFLSIELTDTESPSGLVVQQARPGLQRFSDDKWLIVASLKVASGFFLQQ